MLLVVLGVCCGSAAGFDIVKDGRASAVVLTPDPCDPIVLDAANCLNKYVQEIAGVRLEVIPESQAGEVHGNIIALGATRLAARAGVNVADVSFDGYIHRVKDNIFFIVGPDENISSKVADSANPVLHNLYLSAHDENRWARLECRRGTLSGVIGFLHDYGGIRWFLPTPMGEKVPKSATIRVPDDLSRKAEPPFACAFAQNIGAQSPLGGRLWGYAPGFYWAAANSFRLPLSCLFLGGHSWVVQVRIFSGSAEALFKTHPEYFAMRDGKRLLGQPHNPMLCTSNPGVVDMLTQTLQQLFDQGWDMVQYNQSDGYRRCECPNCDAMDGYRTYESGKFTEPCERLFIPLKEIAERCFRSHPNKKILAMIYGPTKLPSAKVLKFPSNVVFQICHTEPEDFDRWRGRGDLFGAWLYWFGAYQAPGVSVKYTPRAAAENIALFHKHGVRVLYWGMGSSGENWGNEGPVYYVIGQLMRDPSLDYRQILHEYHTGVYGDAADTMREYFDCLYDRIDRYYLAQVGSSLAQIEEVGSAEAFFTSVYPPQALERLQGLLDSARGLAKDERAKMWYALTADQFQYIKTTANVFHAYREYKKAPTQDLSLRLRARLDERNEYLDRLMAYGRDKSFVENWYPGYAGITRYARYGSKGRSKLGVPFTEFPGTP